MEQGTFGRQEGRRWLAADLTARIRSAPDTRVVPQAPAEVSGNVCRDLVEKFIAGEVER